MQPLDQSKTNIPCLRKGECYNINMETTQVKEI